MGGGGGGIIFRCHILLCFEKTHLMLCNTLNCTIQRYCNSTCEDTISAINVLLDNIFVRFGNKVFRQTVGIFMGTNCVPIIAGLFLFCFESPLMTELKKVCLSTHLLVYLKGH